MDSQYIDALLDWMHEQALQRWNVPALLSGLAKRLRDGGMPINRAHIGIPVLHPLYMARAYTWTVIGDVEVDLHEKDHNPTVEKSPLRLMFERGDNEARIALDAASDMSEFPMFQRAIAQGATEWIAQLSGFYDRELSQEVSIEKQEGVVVTWLCDALGGFTDAQITVLRRLRAPLAALLKSFSQRQLVEDILRNVFWKTSALGAD